MSYKSRVEWVESGEQTNILPTIYRRPHESGSRRLIPIKKANMYAWIELEKLSQVCENSQWCGSVLLSVELLCNCFSIT